MHHRNMLVVHGYKPIPPSLRGRSFNPNLRIPAPPAINRFFSGEWGIDGSGGKSG